MLTQVLVALGEEVEGDEARRRLGRQLRHPARGGMDAHLQPIEVEALLGGDHDLAVQHRSLGQRAPQLLDELGEVPVERALVPAAELDLVAVAEHDAAEAVPLRFVEQPVAGRQLANELREHRRDRRRDRERHARLASTAATASPVASSSSSPVARIAALDHAPLQPAGTHGEARGHADQVGVGELDPGARVAIVVQHLDTRGGELVVEAICGRDHVGGLLALARKRYQVHVVRSDRCRPCESEVVVVLLGDGRDRARHSDPVATHHHRMLLASLVGVGALERLCVLGAQLEHLADLDAPVDRERLAATRTRVARDDLRDVGPNVDVEVTVEHGATDVVVGVVRAGDPRAARTHEAVGDDQ